MTVVALVIAIAALVLAVGCWLTRPTDDPWTRECDRDDD